MPHLYTRAEFRDRIRRKLGIVPPIDVPGSNALAGDQPTNAVYPTNQQINDALSDAISDTNRACQWHVLQFTVPVAAPPAGTLGPFSLDMHAFDPNTVGQIFFPPGLINDVLRVLWVPDGGVPNLLKSANRNALDRGGVNDYYQIGTGVPEWWYIEQYKIYISPAQSSHGTLLLTCGTGITGLQCEGDTIDQLPIDFQPVMEYQAIVRLAKTQTLDIEAQERAAMFGTDAALGMRQIQEWREGLSGTPQPSIGFSSYRGGYGTRRTVR